MQPRPLETQLSIVIDTDVKRALAHRAIDEGVGMSALVNQLLRTALGLDASVPIGERVTVPARADGQFIRRERAAPRMDQYGEAVRPADAVVPPTPQHHVSDYDATMTELTTAHPADALFANRIRSTRR